MAGFDESRPIFLQLAEMLEEGIISGAYPEEGQIPSITEFSAALKINPATALKGINLLVDEGLVYKKRGVGMFVATGARDALLAAHGYEPAVGGIRKAELLRRPGITLAELCALEGRELPDAFVARRAEIEIKYEGYIQKQLAEVARQSAAERRRIPPDIDYTQIRGLRTEAVQKLTALRPETVGRASRVSGVSPADIAVLLLYLKG